MLRDRSAQTRSPASRPSANGGAPMAPVTVSAPFGRLVHRLCSRESRTHLARTGLTRAKCKRAPRFKANERRHHLGSLASISPSTCNACRRPASGARGPWKRQRCCHGTRSPVAANAFVFTARRPGTCCPASRDDAVRLVHCETASFRSFQQGELALVAAPETRSVRVKLVSLEPVGPQRKPRNLV